MARAPFMHAACALTHERRDAASGRPCGATVSLSGLTNMRDVRDFSHPSTDLSTRRRAKPPHLHGWHPSGSQHDPATPAPSHPHTNTHPAPPHTHTHPTPCTTTTTTTTTTTATAPPRRHPPQESGVILHELDKVGCGAAYGKVAMLAVHLLKPLPNMRDRHLTELVKEQTTWRLQVRGWGGGGGAGAGAGVATRDGSVGAGLGACEVHSRGQYAWGLAARARVAPRYVYWAT